MNLKNLRKARRHSQEEVAQLVSVSRQAVAKWESGETMPDINNCIALAKLYGITLDELMHGPSERDNDEHVHPKGKYIFGTVHMGERGQIVIPKKAREVFGIKPGDSLLVLGDEAQGIAIIKSEGIEAFARGILGAKQLNEEEKDG